MLEDVRQTQPLLVGITGAIVAPGVLLQIHEAVGDFTEWGAFTPCGGLAVKHMDGGPAWWVSALFAAAHAWVVWGFLTSGAKASRLLRLLLALVACGILFVHVVDTWIWFWCSR